MKILITGTSGYVGRLLRDHLARSFEVVGTSLTSRGDGSAIPCDLRDRESVAAIASQVHPDVVIHAAGDKDIGRCESSPAAAYETNALATENVATAFRKASKVIYISTDYVFEGSSGGYGERHAPAPRTVYGASKLGGEGAGLRQGLGNFYVVRTAAVYSREARFFRYLETTFARGLKARCYSDASYSPTYWLDLAQGLMRIVAYSGERRLFHLCGPPISRYGFACLFARAIGADASDVIECPRPAAEWYLYRDLSMDDGATRAILGMGRSSHEEALGRIASHGRTDAIPGAI